MYLSPQMFGVSVVVSARVMVLVPAGGLVIVWVVSYRVLVFYRSSSFLGHRGLRGRVVVFSHTYRYYKYL